MFKLNSILLALLTGVVAILAVASAAAAPRTVCYEFEIRDERFDCPTPGTVGVTRACDPGANYVNPVGTLIELWDKDSGDGSNDEFIGEFVIAGTGPRCVTFEWENASYAGTEDDPDVYLKLRYEVQATGAENNATVRSAAADGTPNTTVTWRNTTQIADNCTGTCDIPGGVMRPTTSSTSDMGQRFQMLDSVQRVLQIYNGDLDGGESIARYPGIGCPTGLATARNDFCIPQDLGSEGDRVAHEMGHLVQMQMFNQDSLRTVLVGGGWNMATDSFETESGATTEGWAAYVGAVSWYNPSTPNVQPFYGGADIETAALAQSNCASNITLPLQAAKAFWDLDDSTNETGTRADVADNDRDNLATDWIARQWDDFDDGTADREDFETGNNGVNVRDFVFHVNDLTAAETMLELNCLIGQEAN